MKHHFGIIPLVLCFFMLTSCTQRVSDPDTVTLWHWMTDRHDAFEKLAAQYEKQTGIKVKIDLYAPSDSYTQKVIASAQANVLPDIFGILDTKNMFATYIRNGYVADLTSEFEANGNEWENRIFPKALNVNRFVRENVQGIKPGIYGVPIDVTNIQMLYNKKLLNKIGVSEPPKTFDEFLEVSKALKLVGISGFVSGWGELWMADCFASNYAFNIMGEGKVMATYEGEVLYTDEDWIKVLSVFQRLSEAGALAAGIVIKPNKEAEQDFALERNAFAFNGSWAVNVYHDMNPDLEYGVMLPPAINALRPMMIWGGAGSSFVVNGRSKRQKEAIAFLKWLTDKEQQAFLAAETRNLPANQEALSQIPEVLAEFAQVMDNTTHPTIWELNEDPQVIERFDKGIQSIIIGEKTPQEVAEEVQQVKQKILNKQNK